MIKIRVASLEDDDAVARLTRELGYESSTASARERLARLRMGSDTVFVAVVEDVVAGWIHVSVVSSLESDDFGEIRGLVVADAFRSKSIGARLVEAAEEWARERGLTRVRVRSNVVRTKARRFYERLGYAVTKTTNVFDKRIDASRDDAAQMIER